jgi:hypothetical protein
MHLRRALTGLAIPGIALGLMASPAAAKSTPTTSAKVVGTVHITGDGTAEVQAQYTCTIADPVNHPGHLWVSVKQNTDGTVDPAVAGEGSGFGGIAQRWEDSHRDPVTCDGKNHVARFAVDQLEDKGRPYGTLVKGSAWVQFCLFDDTTPQGDGETDFGQPVSSMVWVNVH